MARPGTFRKGFDARRSRGGGKKGRSGRKPDAWKRIMAECATRSSTLRALNRILRNDKHPAFIGALKFAASYGYGKPEERLEVKGKIGLEAILARSWKKRRKALPRAGQGEVKSLHPATPTLRRLTSD